MSPILDIQPLQNVLALLLLSWVTLFHHARNTLNRTSASLNSLPNQILGAGLRDCLNCEVVVNVYLSPPSPDRAWVLALSSGTANGLADGRGLADARTPQGAILDREQHRADHKLARGRQGRQEGGSDPYGAYAPNHTGSHGSTGLLEGRGSTRLHRPLKLPTGWRVHHSCPDASRANRSPSAAAIWTIRGRTSKRPGGSVWLGVGWPGPSRRHSGGIDGRVMPPKVTNL